MEFSDSGSLHDNDYVTAARVPDGSLVSAFCPTSTTITVDMTQMRGDTRASWFNPSNGFSELIAKYGHNVTTVDFTTPDNNGWVLVLESP